MEGEWSKEYKCILYSFLIVKEGEYSTDVGIVDSRVLYSNTESSELEYSPLKRVLYKFTRISQSEYSTEG